MEDKYKIICFGANQEAGHYVSLLTYEEIQEKAKMRDMPENTKDVTEFLRDRIARELYVLRVSSLKFEPLSYLKTLSSKLRLEKTYPDIFGETLNHALLARLIVMDIFRLRRRYKFGKYGKLML